MRVSSRIYALLPIGSRGSYPEPSADASHDALNPYDILCWKEVGFAVIGEESLLVPLNVVLRKVSLAEKNVFCTAMNRGLCGYNILYVSVYTYVGS